MKSKTNVAAMSQAHAREAGYRYYVGKVCDRHPELEGLRRSSRGTCIECERDYREANRESARRYRRKYHETKHERVLENKRNYREANREIEREITRKWKKANPAKVCAYDAARRARKRNAIPDNMPGIHEAFAVARALANRLEELHGFPFHVDHIIPLALGGHHEPSNWQIISAEDNHRKGARADFTDYQWPRWLIGE